MIYAKTDASGNVQGVYAVNHFQTDEIIDYGNYSEVKPLNTTDEINLEKDKITIHSDSDNVYYEGTAESKDLPWIFQINYTLDGKAISPQDLPGKSGELTMDISVKANKAIYSTFFDHYALQSTVTLDTNCAELISAEGATVATVGENKQLSYILLPGKEQNLTITTKVKNFEMDPITFNGIRMGLDLDLDTGELDDAIAQGIDLSTSKASTATAIATLQSDINDISTLISTLQSYEALINAAGQGDTYSSCLNTLYGMRSDLNSAIAKLNANASAFDYAEGYVAGLHQKTAAAKTAAEGLSTNYEDFHKELISLATTLTDTITNMNDLAAGIHALCENYAVLNTGIQDYTTGTAALVEGYNTAAQNLALLSLGSQQLAYYTEAMAQGSDTLHQYTLQLADGTFTLAQGAAAFHRSTAGMDETVNEKINTMIDTLTGSDGETISFTSDKNTKVTALQFVISEEGIKLPE